MIRKHKKAENVDDLISTFKQTNMITPVLAHYANCRSYRKIGGTIDGLRGNEKYFSVELPYKDMNENFLYWLLECQNFVYITTHGGILFGFSDRNDAIVCKLKYMGKGE